MKAFLNTVFEKGRFSKLTINEVMEISPRYIQLCILKLKRVKFKKKVLKRLESMLLIPKYKNEEMERIWIGESPNYGMYDKKYFIDYF